MHAAPDMTRLQSLNNSHEVEVIAFLMLRPVHTVVMASWINDNTLESDLNRGKFYGYRNVAGMLEGVALIGHTTLVEARSKDALTAFAVQARRSDTPIHVMMSGADTIESFWEQYKGDKSKPRLTCNEVLFELGLPALVRDCEFRVRAAAKEELLPIAEAHAEVAFMESGVDPIVKDREGFLERTLRRIEQGRTFVVFDEKGTLVFKADIVAETAGVIYLEGIYVAEKHRGKGIGSKCLAALGQSFLKRVDNVCLLSNVEFAAAHKAYLNAGFKATGRCVTIFA
jgi:uncharacterized protein